MNDLFFTMDLALPLEAVCSFTYEFHVSFKMSVRSPVFAGVLHVFTPLSPR